MKKIFFFLLVVFSQRAISQTSFTKFIEKSSVTWAADATNTFRFDRPNLSLLLRERFNKEEIKVSIGEFDADFEKRKNASKQNVIDRIAPGKQAVGGEVAETENPLLSAKYFDSLSSNLVEIKQVLYIESGRLQSYVPWVTTKFSVYNSNLQPLGIANCFSTAFHTSQNIKAGERKKAIPLGTTNTIVRLVTIQTGKSLKQMYGRNMLESLWPILQNKHFEIYRIDSNIQVPFSKINSSLIDDSNISIPYYDSLGNLTGKLISAEIQPFELSFISAIELQQDWFYSSKNNLVFNIIRQLILYAHKWKDGQKESFASPVLKIILR